MTFDYDSSQRKLTVRGATNFPAQAYDYAEEIEIMDMSHGELAEFPEDMSRFKNLKVAFFSYNNFRAVPNLSACEKLETLGMRHCKISRFDDNTLPARIRAIILTENSIKEIPRTIGNLHHLQKLSLTGNKLEGLPKELANCTNLEFIRLAVNNLPAPPTWLFHMPRLAWYADSNNPYSPAPANIPTTYEWSKLHIGEILGKSNNNEVRLATLTNGDKVAVKLFGHEIVTDGRPEDDMNACLLAGDHPNITGGLGEVIHTPNMRKAMVMPLLAPEENWEQLASPPNLKTVCHDTYTPEKTFSLSFIVQALKTMSAGYAHLHSRGIQHGDAYGHNTVAMPDGTCRVGDFGAASLYKAGTDEGSLREKLDVLAFSHQIDELLSRCTDTNSSLLEELRILQLACAQPDVTKRPSFSEINTALSLKQ